MMILLRITHILFGVFWVGTVMTMAVFLLPSARAIGPAAGPMMGQLTGVRQLPRWLIIAGAMTILSGFWMYWKTSNGFSPEWMGSGPGKVFGLGAVFALVGWFMGMMLNAPLAKRIGAMAARLAAAGAPPSTEDAAALKAMQARLYMLTVSGALLLTLATMCMAVARYVTP